jgi:hypothetical protein
LHQQHNHFGQTTHVPPKMNEHAIWTLLKEQETSTKSSIEMSMVNGIEFPIETQKNHNLN